MESELRQIEEKHDDKKRQCVEESDTFHQQLKKLCEEKPVISMEMFTSMIAKAKDEMREKWEQQQAAEQEMLKAAVSLLTLFSCLL